MDPVSVTVTVRSIYAVYAAYLGFTLSLKAPAGVKADPLGNIAQTISAGQGGTSAFFDNEITFDDTSSNPLGPDGSGSIPSGTYGAFGTTAFVKNLPESAIVCQ